MEMTHAIDWSREALRMILLLGGPLLAAALVVGLLINVGQTLTQLHEPVVGLVPRLVGGRAGSAVDSSLAARAAGSRSPPNCSGRYLTCFDRDLERFCRESRIVPWESGELDWPWLLCHASVCGLVLARVLGLCLTAPGLAIPELDWRFRIGLAAVLGVVLIPVVEPSIVAPVGWQSVASASFLELLAGAVLGYLAATIVAGARMAGELVAAQAGLSTSTLLDPETGEEIGPLGRLYGWIAVVAFLGLGGPLILVKVLAESYQDRAGWWTVDLSRDRQAGICTTGPCARAGAAGRGARRAGAGAGRNHHGMAQPRGVVASVCRTRPADPHADRRRAASPQPGDPVCDALRRLADLLDFRFGRGRRP